VLACNCDVIGGICDLNVRKIWCPLKGNLPRKCVEDEAAEDVLAQVNALHVLSVRESNNTTIFPAKKSAVHKLPTVEATLTRHQRWKNKTKTKTGKNQ